MKTRSVTDQEIALIKAMIARDMPNKDIQFFFNRPDRPVNSGRISQIRKGNYSNCAAIATASAEELDSFLDSFKPTGVSAAVAVPGSQTPALDTGPTGIAALKAMFTNDKEVGCWRFRHGESDQHECKEGFGFKHADKWLRAVAALANNKGGYVVFGVRDKTIVADKIAEDSFKVIGLDNAEFENADPVEFTKRLKATFDPTPLVEATSIEIGGKKVGIFRVHQHASRPIIALKGEGQQVKEGEIYFRYPGQSSRIKYSDLRAILDDRDRAAREQILPMVEKLLSLGPRDAMVADLATGTLADGKHTLVIGEDLLDRIKFIREGEFDEKGGAPTLRLIGDVQTVDQSEAIIRKGFATPADLIRDFLDQASPYEPKEYIRCAVEGGGGAWLPLHYYARKAGMSQKQLTAFIAGTAASRKRKETFTDRANGKSTAFQKSAGRAAAIKALLESGETPEVKSLVDATALARAIMGLTTPPAVGIKDLLELFRHCIALIEAEGSSGALSQVRRAIARVDELYFAGNKNAQ